MSIEKVDLKIHIKDRLKTAQQLRRRGRELVDEANVIESEANMLARDFEIDLTKGETK